MWSRSQATESLKSGIEKTSEGIGEGDLDQLEESASNGLGHDGGNEDEIVDDEKSYKTLGEVPIDSDERQSPNKNQP